MKKILAITVTFCLISNCYSFGESKLIPAEKSSIKKDNFQITILSVSKSESEYDDYLEDEMDVYWVHIRIKNLGDKIRKLRFISMRLKDKDVPHYMEYYEPEVKEIYKTNPDTLDLESYKNSESISLLLENTDTSIPVRYNMLERADTKAQFIKLDHEKGVKWNRQKVIPNSIPTETRLYAKYDSQIHRFYMGGTKPHMTKWLRPNEEQTVHFKFLVYQHARVKAINKLAGDSDFQLKEGVGPMN